MNFFPQSLPGARQHSESKVTTALARLPLVPLGLGAIVVLAAILRFANIGAIGESNTYYTAAVESMLQSWRNFFFVAAEPGGSVSVDKPPVGLWLQAISAYFLGVNGFAVVLPQILAGLFSVVLIFFLVRRWFGDAAGLLASLVLAITPVAIAVERNNTPDATLILFLLLAAWGFIRATETHKLRYLLLGAAMIGIGFNIKMMQALLPLPAMYAMYFFGTRQNWWKKVLHLTAATLVLIPVALSWATIVELTPADQRPYVGSSENNSVFNLIFGYNGVERLTGQGGGTPPTGQAPANGTTPPSGAQAPDGAMGTPPTGRTDGTRDGGTGSRTGGMFGTGSAGPLRMFESGLASQVSWLLPFGLFSIAGIGTVLARRRWLYTDYARGLILWGGWLVTCVVFFSVAGFFHQYYLAMLAAPLAVVVAIGALFLWQAFRTTPRQAAGAAMLGIGVTLGFQMYAVQMYNTIGLWVAAPLVLALAGAVLLVLGLRRERMLLVRWALGLLVAAMLVVPAVWSGLTVLYSNSNLPTAYTGGQGNNPGAFGGRDGSTANAGGVGSGSVNEELLAYLEANTQLNKYLLVVPSSQAGAGYVLATGRPVLYAGGFGGSDPVLDAQELASMAATGEVRYVLWGGNGGRSGSSDISSYLESSCSVVTEVSTGASGGMNGGQTLYDCAN